MSSQLQPPLYFRWRSCVTMRCSPVWFDLAQIPTYWWWALGWPTVILEPTRPFMPLWHIERWFYALLGRLHIGLATGGLELVGGPS